jgi:hypothetical protein
MSTSDIIFFQSGNPITWQASKQKVVALSSCEAEYVVAAAVACQAVWLVCLLADMVRTKCGVPELKVDNQSAITLCKNHVFHHRSKHINIRYHFIQECFVVSYMVTKAMGRTRLQELGAKVGVQSISERA